MQHFYESIEGWSHGITELYQKMVQRFPSGSHFVEVGTWLGRSCAFMCVEIVNSGKKIEFDVVDHWKGTCHDPDMMDTAEKRNLFKEFKDAMVAGGVANMIGVKKMSSVKASWEYADNSLDFVFLDGSHDRASVEHDILAWWPKVKAGGVLAGHDYYGFSNPWVQEAVDNLLPGQITTEGPCWVLNKKAGSPAPDARNVKPRVYLALPNRPGDSFSARVVESLFHTGSRHVVMNMHTRAMSLLNYNFNTAWCDALNRRGEFEYFVMQHSDVAAENGYVDKLMLHHGQCGADVLSCVIAIKDDWGKSSTGLMRRRDNTMGKLTIRQCLGLPKVFTAEMTGVPNTMLLINTGLWICKMDKPWVEEITFRGYDKNKKNENGDWTPGDAIGEDYLFSLDLDRLGCKVAATTAVKILHRGGYDYSNVVPWGRTDNEEIKDVRDYTAAGSNGKSESIAGNRSAAGAGHAHAGRH